MQSFIRSSEKRELTWTGPLLDLGYYRFPPRRRCTFSDRIFKNFSHFCAALKAHYATMDPLQAQN